MLILPIMGTPSIISVLHIQESLYLYDIVSLPFLVYLLVLGFSARDVTNISFLLTMFVFTFFFFPWRHDYLLPASIANDTRIRERMFIAPRKHPVS